MKIQTLNPALNNNNQLPAHPQAPVQSGLSADTVAFTGAIGAVMTAAENKAWQNFYVQLKHSVKEAKKTRKVIQGTLKNLRIEKSSADEIARPWDEKIVKAFNSNDPDRWNLAEQCIPVFALRSMLRQCIDVQKGWLTPLEKFLSRRELRAKFMEEYRADGGLKSPEPSAAAIRDKITENLNILIESHRKFYPELYRKSPKASPGTAA